ncbi:MAG: amidohydrolase family protein, partial [candidate division WOR-3 bacterium]
KGFAPYEMIKSLGLEIALASDHNPGTSPFLNPFITLFLAVYSLGMKPKEVFMSHTYTAAKSLGLKDIGKIDVGYKAMVFAMDYTPEEWAYYGDLKPVIKFPLDGDKIQP